MEIIEKKRKGDVLEHEHQKKQRGAENSEINYILLIFLDAPLDLELLPLEIVHLLAKLTGSYPTVLLSLTCKPLYSSLSNDNKFWFSLFRHERSVNLAAVHVQESTLQRELKVLQEEEVYLLTESESEELTANTAAFQHELIADDHLRGIVSIFDDPINYDIEVYYKDLAIDEWLKRQHFELWRKTYFASNCTCSTEHTILALYDEHGNELSLDDDSLSDDDREMLPADSTIESESVSNEEHESDSSMMTSAQNSSDESESDDDEIVPVMLNAELRDKIIQSVANSAQLKMFIQVLDAAVLGHIPSSTCPDTRRLAKAKLNHPIVCLGNVVDEVIDQISLAVNNTNMRQCLSMLFCAFQKLCIADLLYLNQGVKSRFPYLVNVFSAQNIDRGVPMSGFNLVGDNMDYWATGFHSQMASIDELDTLPYWLSLRHSIHKLMRNYTMVKKATPGATEHGYEALVDFVRCILQSVIDMKGTSSSSIDVTEQDIFKAVCKDPRNIDLVAFNIDMDSELMCENMVQMYSESECSDASSYSDASEEEEDLAQFVEENKKNIIGYKQSVQSVTSEQKPEEEESSEEDLNDYQGLTALIKSSVQGVDDDTSPLLMRTAVVYGQSDLSAQQLDDLSDEASYSDNEQQVERDLIYWLQVNDDEYNDECIDKMPYIIAQDAAYYAGSGETGDRAEEKMNTIDSQVPSDLPELRQDLTDQQRAKILEVRHETNRVLKDEIMREHNEFLTKKFARLHDNFTNYHGTKHPLQCKTMRITFFSDNKKNIKRAVDEAIALIRESDVLKSVHIYDHGDEDNDENVSDSQTPIQSLFTAIQNSTSIDSLKLYGCYFHDVSPLIQLLQSKQFTRLHLVFTNVCGSVPLEVLQKSLKDLAIDYPLLGTSHHHIYQTVLALVPNLDVLKLNLKFKRDEHLMVMQHLKELMPKLNSLQKVVLCFDRFDLHQFEFTDQFIQARDDLITAAKPAHVIVTSLP